MKQANFSFHTCQTVYNYTSKDVTFVVKVNFSVVSEAFSQGEVLSAPLFSIFVSDLYFIRWPRKEQHLPDRDTVVLREVDGQTEPR